MDRDCRTCKYNGTDDNKCYWCFRHDTELNQRYSKWQPKDDVPDMNVEDMISRKVAMEMLMAQNVIMDGSEYHNGFNAGVNRAQEVIRNLPPVQPKRTCVNCGRTVNNGGWYADGRTRCPIEEHYALPKDGFCHLWEKRNVTDDDYPERREDERPES